MTKGFNYGQDVGSYHITAFYLNEVVKAMTDAHRLGIGFLISGRHTPPAEVYIHDPEDWSRYDGELQ